MTGLWAALRLRADIFFGLLITTALWSPLTEAVPAGTVINNTATVDYVASGVPKPTLSASDSFTVIAGIQDSADLTLTTSATQNVYPGTSTTMDINVTNTGYNTLSSGELHITAPLNITVGLTGNGVAPISQSSTATTTTHVFSLADIAATASETAVATLGLPVGLDPTNNNINVKYVGNGTDITSTNTALNISNRFTAELELMQYSQSLGAQTTIINTTEFKQSDGSFAPISAPIVPGTVSTLVTDAPVPLEPAQEFSHNQAFFVQIKDLDQNIDDGASETIEVSLDISVTGETEVLRLTETTPNSGVFTGYIQLAMSLPTQNNGILEVSANSNIVANYIDIVDPSDIISIKIIVDPFGKIFDGATGLGMNGYTVHLVDVNTGLPANVYGDDGVSSYPATMVTGSPVTDASGKVYNYGDGEYRFPFADLGDYQLVVVPPSGALYSWPSTRDTLQLINLPGGPFAVTLGSRGEYFKLFPGPPLHIDIPVDPLTEQMYVQRSASKNTVGPGDFIEFRIKLDNIATAILNNVTLNETLPKGFRLESGSVLIDGVAANSSIVTDNGNTIAIDLGNMAIADSHTIEYVVAVGVAKLGSAPSSSQATANLGAASSNTATVNTIINEELMHSRAMLMGRVAIDTPEDTSAKNTHKQGVEGIRIYMEDGRYAITDKRGMYHFENVKPGRHVVQIDQTTVPSQYQVKLVENNTRFAGNAASQFVDIQGGTLWRTDFYLEGKALPTGKMSLTLNSEPPINDYVQYHALINSDTVPLSNMSLTVVIPEYAKYVFGTSTANDKSISEPMIIDNILIYRLNDADGNWNTDISFIISGINDGPTDIITKALVKFDSPTKKGQRTQPVTDITSQNNHIYKETNETFIIIPNFKPGSAELSAKSQAELNAIANELATRNNLEVHTIGHSDTQPFRKNPANPLITNNMELSEYRARVIAELLQKTLKLPDERISYEGMSYYEPIADNSTTKGRRVNRRVHIFAYSNNEKSIGRKPPAELIAGPVISTISVETSGSHFAEIKTPVNQDVTEKSINDFDNAWLNTQDASIEWVYLPELPPIASTHVMIKHHFNQRVSLYLNGAPVPGVNYEGMMRSNNGAATSLWRGIDLIEGDNLFEAVIHDENNIEISRMSKQIHYSGPPVSAILMAEQSSLVADGLSKPEIAIRLTDIDGYPATKGSIGRFEINSPYRPENHNEFSIENMPGAQQELHTYVVGDDGIALITLEPTSQPGDLNIQLPLAFDNDTEINTRLKAAARDWILVGLAESTIGYNDLNTKLESANNSIGEDGLYKDGRIAFYAKGQILGQWLLTLAYDTDKEQATGTDPNLFQAIDPGTYYTVYGDTGHNGFDAASSEKLYLRLESDDLFLLYGDYETNLNKTSLSKYNRTLTGLKSRYQDDKYDVIVFSSQSNQAFIKDEIRGEGISGPYQLSRNNIALNSDKIIIETRNRFRSEDIIETQSLSRHVDYDIDYSAGTISFRSPIMSTNQDLNPVYIVAKYESFDKQDVSATYGGRGEVKLNEKITIGVSHIREGLTGGEAQLDGLDTTITITDKTNLKLETAHSSNGNETGILATGNAYLAELNHKSGDTAAKVYISEQDQGFGLGQTNGSENGMRKFGAEASKRISDQLTLKGQTFRHENIVTQATRDVAEAEAQTTLHSTHLKLGLRSAHDQRGDGSEQNSNQITAGASKAFIDNRVTLRIDREQNLSSDNSIDYPNRTRAGVDVKINDTSKLFVEQEFADGSVRSTRSTLMGVKSNPLPGSQLYTGVRKTDNENGEETSATTAASQSWLLSDEWKAELGIEHTRTLSLTPGTQLNHNIPFASGSNNDFTATSIGVSYNTDHLLWTARIENRIADDGDQMMLATSVQTEPNTAISLLAGLTIQNKDTITGEQQKNTNIHLGFAYRPENSRWIVLDKLELKWNETNGQDFDNEGKRIINNLNLNYKEGRWQHSIQYGAKSVKETIRNNNYSSYVDLTGFETRYDISPSWDLGVHGNVLHAWKLDQFEYNSGISVGHSVANNIWLSLGYNFTGFQDSDFSSSRYTNQGVYFKFRLKFDQATVKEAVKWANN